MKQDSLMEKLSGFAEYGQDIVAIFEKLADDKTKSSVGHLLQGLGEKLSELGDHLAGEEEEEDIDADEEEDEEEDDDEDLDEDDEDLDEDEDEDKPVAKAKGKPATAPKSNAKASPAPRPSAGNKKK